MSGFRTTSLVIRRFTFGFEFGKGRNFGFSIIGKGAYAIEYLMYVK